MIIGLGMRCLAFAMAGFIATILAAQFAPRTGWPGLIAALTLAIMGALAWRANRRWRARIAALQLVLRKVQAGEVSARPDTASRRDELDDLSRDIAALLMAFEKQTTKVEEDSKRAMHEVYRPFGPLMNQLRKAQRGKTLEELRAHIAEISASVEAAIRHSRSVLDRPGDADQVPHSNLSGLLQEAALRHLVSANEKGLLLSARIEEDLWSPASESHWRTILDNLISNAIKYTAEGGISLVLRRKGSDFRLLVADTGMGIPKKEQLFGFMVRARNVRHIAGHGVGLSVVENLCRLYDFNCTLANGDSGAEAVVTGRLVSAPENQRGCPLRFAP